MATINKDYLSALMKEEEHIFKQNCYKYLYSKGYDLRKLSKKELEDIDKLFPFHKLILLVEVPPLIRIKFGLDIVDGVTGKIIKTNRNMI